MFLEHLNLRLLVELHQVYLFDYCRLIDQYHIHQMSLEKPILEPVECIPEWPRPTHAKRASFFDNLSGDKRVLENNSRRLFADSEKMNMEACTISLRGM
jgi:hypothetical protein